MKIRVLLILAAVISGIHFLNIFTGYQISRFGISPRVVETLPHIYSAPLLHGNTAHLVNNLIGLMVFSSLCLLRGIKFYLWSSFIIITLTGLMVWLFARPAIHIGASGWIFGLWSLTIAMAWFDRRFINIVIAVFVIFFYGGMFYGVLPGRPGVSFESHLFGAVAGVICALLMAKTRRYERVRKR